MLYNSGERPFILFSCRCQRCRYEALFLQNVYTTAELDARKNVKVAEPKAADTPRPGSTSPKRKRPRRHHVGLAGNETGDVEPDDARQPQTPQQHSPPGAGAQTDQLVPAAVHGVPDVGGAVSCANCAETLAAVKELTKAFQAQKEQLAAMEDNLANVFASWIKSKPENKRRRKKVVKSK